MYVELNRGSIVESEHAVDVAVVDADGRVRATAGDPDRVTYFRSAAKPFQALPLVLDGAVDRYGITRRELALCCGSHSGEPRHVRTVQALLSRVGASPDMLACGPHAPWDRPSREALRERGLEPGRLHNNCSGKHAGMIALARNAGWEAAGYARGDHPVQARVLREISEWTGLPEEAIALGTDGCGVTCFGVPIRSMALAYARLASAARAGTPAASAVVGAMTAHPDMVAGEGRLCTDLMRSASGRLFAKTGAEGVYCVGIPGAEVGIALKVRDGHRRAIGPAVISVLSQLEMIGDPELGALESHAFPEVINTAGDRVGRFQCAGALTTPDA